MLFKMQPRGFFTLDITPVWDSGVLLILEHRFGKETLLFDGEVTAKIYLYQWVVRNWDKKFMYDPLIPLSQEEATEAYFRSTTDTYEITYMCLPNTVDDVRNGTVY